MGGGRNWEEWRGKELGGRADLLGAINILNCREEGRKKRENVPWTGNYTADTENI